MSRDHLYTHNFFPYPAKFPPEPIKEHILKYTEENDTILDPFCGSGTVLVEAMLHNRNAIGIDLNPVSALISKAKSRLYKNEDLLTLKNILVELENILQVRDMWVFNSVNDSDIPNYKNRELWFKENMLYEMAAIRKIYLSESKYNDRVSNLLWMAFLKIVVEVSNQEADNRYASIVKVQLVDGFALTKFIKTLKDYYKTLLNSSFTNNGHIESSINVFEGDSNIEILNIEDESLDFAITSPPYINTFDYYLYHKHRIFWMGKDPQYVRKNEIGNHHRIDTMSFEKAYNEYYDSMSKIIGNVGKKLKKGKYFVMLIGDGIVKGQLVKADKLISEICLDTGFTVEDVITTSLRDVSKGFIKGRNLDIKQHYTIIMKR